MRKREREGGREVRGLHRVSHHRGLNCYCKLSAGAVGVDIVVLVLVIVLAIDIVVVDGGILSVAKLKYRAKVYTLDNARALSRHPSILKSGNCDSRPLVPYPTRPPPTSLALTPCLHSNPAIFDAHRPLPDIYIYTDFGIFDSNPLSRDQVDRRVTFVSRSTCVGTCVNARCK